MRLIGKHYAGSADARSVQLVKSHDSWLKRAGRPGCARGHPDRTSHRVVGCSIEYGRGDEVPTLESNRPRTYHGEVDEFTNGRYVGCRFRTLQNFQVHAMNEGSPSNPNTPDVRMRGFSHRSTVEQAWGWLDRHALPRRTECVPLSETHGRVLAADIRSQYDVPGFNRSMMDGFALCSADIAGASPYNRLALTVIGQVLPGHPFSGRVQRGQAVRIMTGGPFPDGADAVIPVERVELDGSRIHVMAEVPPGKHVGRRGEDVASGEVVLKSGRRVRPQDVGLLASIGVSHVDVVAPVRTRIVVTGDELLPAGSAPCGHRIVDSNSPMLIGLIKRDGGTVEAADIVPDDPDTILRAMREDAEVVLVSGGSSVGQEDHAPRLLAQHGELAIHGIAMRPSSPAGFGRLDQRFVFLLPGNPVSCLCAYDFFAGRAIRTAAGVGQELPYARVRLPLRRKLVSVVGRMDYARVAVVDESVEPIAISGASVLSSTIRADGFVVIPGDSEGYSAGTVVEVFLYD